jgi:hypothetical protein
MRATYVAGPLVAICAVVLMAGCASIVSKSIYPISITSDPNQADVTITDETGKTVFTGTTPAEVKLGTKAGFFKGKDYTVTFTKAGYGKHVTQIRRGVDGWYIAGNLLLGGLIGWLIVDPATGAMWTLQSDVHASLSQQTSSREGETGIRVVSLDDVPASLRSKMVRVR